MDQQDNGQAFDLSAYELEDTAILTVQNAKGDDDLLGQDGKPVTIEFYGAGADQSVKAEHKLGTKATLRAQMMWRGNTKGLKDAAKEAESDQVDRLVMRTKKISDNFPIAPRALYSNPKLNYITRQAIKWLDDDANFAKPASES